MRLSHGLGSQPGRKGRRRKTLGWKGRRRTLTSRVFEFPCLCFLIYQDMSKSLVCLLVMCYWIWWTYISPQTKWNKFSWFDLNVQKGNVRKIANIPGHPWIYSPASASQVLGWWAVPPGYIYLIDTNILTADTWQQY